MREYPDIIDQLDMYCCPRCMAVAYGNTQGWDTVIVDDATDLLDTVCPDCLTEYDLTRPDRAERLEQIDAELRRILGGDA